MVDDDDGGDGSRSVIQDCYVQGRRCRLDWKPDEKSEGDLNVRISP